MLRRDTFWRKVRSRFDNYRMAEQLCCLRVKPCHAACLSLWRVLCDRTARRRAKKPSRTHREDRCKASDWSVRMKTVLGRTTLRDDLWLKSSKSNPTVGLRRTEQVGYFLSFWQFPDGQKTGPRKGGKWRVYAACSARVLWTRLRLIPRACAISRMVCPCDRKAWRWTESMLTGFRPTRSAPG